MKQRDFQYVCSNGFPKEPVVSVLVLAYNHEKFIAQALDSIVCQLTDFPYEIVVGEDCSSDATKEICMDYQRRYPDKVKLLLQKKNKGLIGNFCDTLRTCKGKFIAECAGDDFWGDEYKLQKHVDYMSQHDDVVITYHDSNVVDENNNLLATTSLEECRKRNFSSKELKDGILVILQTSCYRSIVVPELLDSFNRRVFNEDSFMTSIIGQYGRGVYLKEIGSMFYRKHRGGIWSMKDEIHKSIMCIGTFGELMLYYKTNGDSEYYSLYKGRMISKFAEVHDKKKLGGDRNMYKTLLFRYCRDIGIKNLIHYLRFVNR